MFADGIILFKNIRDIFQHNNLSPFNQHILLWRHSWFPIPHLLGQKDAPLTSTKWSHHNCLLDNWNIPTRWPWNEDIQTITTVFFLLGLDKAFLVNIITGRMVNSISYCRKIRVFEKGLFCYYCLIARYQKIKLSSWFMNYLFIMQRMV